MSAGTQGMFYHYMLRADSRSRQDMCCVEVSCSGGKPPHGMLLMHDNRWGSQDAKDGRSAINWVGNVFLSNLLWVVNVSWGGGVGCSSHIKHLYLCLADYLRLSPSTEPRQTSGGGGEWKGRLMKKCKAFTVCCHQENRAVVLDVTLAKQLILFTYLFYYLFS